MSLTLPKGSAHTEQGHHHAPFRHAYWRSAHVFDWGRPHVTHAGLPYHGAVPLLLLALCLYGWFALVFISSHLWQWMLVEAYVLYRTFVTVFTKGSIPWASLLAFAYGIPSICLIIAAATRWDQFGSERNCWLSTEYGTVWAFIAPMLVVIAINCVVFIIVIKHVLTMGRRIRRRSSSMEEVSKFANLKKGIKATMSFFSLLGITWLFGALAIGDASLAFFYLFAICNSLQGLFIFIFHCYLDPRFVPSHSILSSNAFQCGERHSRRQKETQVWRVLATYDEHIWSQAKTILQACCRCAKHLPARPGYRCHSCRPGNRWYSCRAGNRSYSCRASCKCM